MKDPVLTKRDFVRRYAAGEFGNASPTWDTLSDWEKDWLPSYVVPVDLSQRFHIRNRIAGGATWYDLFMLDVPYVWHEVALNSGLSKSQLYISEMAPTDKTLIQGEVMEAPQGLYLYYTQVKKPMRDALKQESKGVDGLLAFGLLKQYMCANSIDWLYHLLREYPEHVIEFSTFSTNWGTLPRFNTVFWEVRKY